MRFLLESSRVPIYERINLALKAALEEYGHEVIFYRPEFFDDDAFLQTINQAALDFYLISNEGAFIQRFSDKYQCYLFELVTLPLIFLFHDNVFCGTGDRKRLEQRYKGLSTVSPRSRIFCIEKSNITDLELRSVENVHFLTHATEFTPSQTPAKNDQIAFVGHTMAGLQTFPLDVFSEARSLIGFAWLRYADVEMPVQHLLLEMAKKTGANDCFIERQYLLNLLNKMTFSLRGEVLGALNVPMTIYGGDLSYGKGDPKSYRINSPNVTYASATVDYRDTAQIYANARININITGLQFDTAINNRVLDVIAAGGVLLTDYKADLLSLFPYAGPVTYRSANELKEKLIAAEDPKALKEIADICAAMRDHLLTHYTYKNTIATILDTL